MSIFLFWNIGKRDIEDLVIEAVYEKEVDVLILAESNIDPSSMINKLNIGQEKLYYLSPGAVINLQIYTRYLPDFIEPVRDTAYITIRNIVLPLSKEVILVGVHLSSKLFESRDDQALECTRIIQEIEKAEEFIGHSNTVVVGDINMNPFEPGIIGAAGFHAVMDRRIAEKGSRKVKGKNYRFFYNPMWNHFGDEGLKPSGTYYYRSSTHTCFFWNMFDQVLLRPELTDVFDGNELEILTSIGSTLLLNKNGKPNRNVGSDHLPILFKLDI